MTVKTLILDENYFYSLCNFANSRSAKGIYSVSSKAVMIKPCNAILAENEFSLHRKSRENKDDKKFDLKN